MNRRIAALLVFLAVALSAHDALAFAPELTLSHSVTASVPGKTVTITIHLQNVGTQSLSALTLSLVPLQPLALLGPSTLRVGNLTADEGRDLTLLVQTPAGQDTQAMALEQPLFFVAKFRDSDGKEVKIPLTSQFIGQGGAK